MTGTLPELLDAVRVHFPAEWVTAALTLNLISTWVVIGLFLYLSQSTGKERFGLWTASWMFYSVYLAATISLQSSPAVLWLLVGQRACLGISALLMFWGSLQLTNTPRPPRELLGGIVLLLLWSAVAAFRVGQSRWVTVPVFALLAAANIYTGVKYLSRRVRPRAARLLGTGFALWGVQLLAFPFLEPTAPTMTAAYLIAAALALFITLGMLVEQEQLVSEQDYRALFESANDALLLVDCQTHTVLEANRVAEQIAGRDAALLVGLPVWELFPDLQERVKDHWAAGRLAEEINRTSETGWQRPDRSRVTCEIRAHVVRCPRGEVLQISARDTSQQKRAAAELLVKSAALEAVENCIILSDRDGLILWVNPAFTAMTGYRLEDAIGEKAWFLKTKERDDALHRELMRVLQGDQPWRGEVTNRRKDGTEYRELMTITPVRDTRGVLTNFVTIKQDLTRRLGDPGQ
jgi:PAS domain S-box-containing protein